VPRETYERECPFCQSRWRIERTTLIEHGGLAMDQVTFTELRARLGNGSFRVNHQYD
jgi:hypothetical protein